MQPVQKVSKRKKRARRSHQALKPTHYVFCPQCNTAKLPHRACASCGFVNAKLAVAVGDSNDD